MSVEAARRRGTARKALVSRSVAVIVPVRNEEDRLPLLLAALNRQRWPTGEPLAPLSFFVVLFCNNCDDRSAVIARQLARSTAFTTIAIEVDLPPALANAGNARRLAFDRAVAEIERLGHQSAILMTTDADCQPQPDWIFRQIQHIEAGAQAVAGNISNSAEEFATLPALLRHRLTMLNVYNNLLLELAELIDPDPDDPPPRHNFEGGASISITLDAFRKIGGMPQLDVGEDKALLSLVRQHGGIVRHPSDVEVVVSCRLDGRARGGMADALREWAAQDDTSAIRDLITVETHIERLQHRARLRDLFKSSPILARTDIASTLGIEVDQKTAEVGLNFWSAARRIERTSRSQTLSFAQLPVAIATARPAVSERQPAECSAH